MNNIQKNINPIISKSQFQRLHLLINVVIWLNILSLPIVVLTWYKIQQKQIEIQQFVCEVIEAQEDASLLSTTQTLGKQLFTQNCIACHTKTDEILVGPGLKGISQRHNEEWIVQWVQNPQKVLKKGDKYANTLYEQYNRADMVPFPHLTTEDIKVIIAYIELYEGAIF
ncbi:cytochrome c [Runella sp. MFBS21]|uniref:c-type cytochrome n=1 Tax=Runella sp. MFBS21 TaxID=3034018 RepID=UPI0023F71F04|nr:cytochrome c [Runella sp. MFBS21]MDF7821658.1 cytochrome c [Runella sp. MFBS21]